MTKTEHDARSIMEFLGNILLGGIVALAICCIFLFLASAAISAGWLKESAIRQLAVAGCAIGTACGAFCAILRCKNRTLLVGLAVAAVFLLLLLTVGLAVYGEIAPEQGGAALSCGSLCGGAGIGLLCGRTPKKKRKT